MSTNLVNQDFSAPPDIWSAVRLTGANELRDNGILRSRIEGAIDPGSKTGVSRYTTSLHRKPSPLESHDQIDEERTGNSIQLRAGNFPQSFSELSLQISISDFDGILALPLIDVDSKMESGVVSLRTAIDKDSALILTLSGELFKEEDRFEIQHVGLSMETTTKLARCDFTLATIRAMLSLSEHVYFQIAEIQLDLGLKFTAPLLDTSKMLRRRQIAYRIMVIERATGYEFELPPDISGEEVENIALVYHAITEGSFDWPVDKVTVFLPATEEWLDRLTSVNKLTSFTLGPDPIVKSLFGKEISLGEGTVTLHDKFIEDIDKIRQELARNDGHVVTAIIRSRIGHGTYDLRGAPRLPEKPWDETIQGLIDLESKLDTALTNLYHALAASTLEGLNEKEKTEITKRSDIGEAFLIDDSHRENE